MSVCFLCWENFSAVGKTLVQWFVSVSWLEFARTSLWECNVGLFLFWISIVVPKFCNDADDSVITRMNERKWMNAKRDIQSFGWMAFVLWITSKATRCLRGERRNIFMHVVCVVKLETLQLRGYSQGDDVTENLQSPGDSYSSSSEPMCVVLVKEIVSGW